MNRREANEQLVAELLQARDAVRLAANPSHFGFDLTLGQAYQIGRELHEGLVSRGSNWSVARSASPTGPCGNSSR